MTAFEALKAFPVLKMPGISLFADFSLITPFGIVSFHEGVVDHRKGATDERALAFLREASR